MPSLEDGIVGLYNNTYYCYMNACLQCFLPIEELRDHYIMQDFADVSSKGQRLKNNFEYSIRLHEFFNLVYSKSSESKRWIIKPEL